MKKKKKKWEEEEEERKPYEETISKAKLHANVDVEAPVAGTHIKQKQKKKGGEGKKEGAQKRKINNKNKNKNTNKNGTDSFLMSINCLACIYLEWQKWRWHCQLGERGKDRKDRKKSEEKEERDSKKKKREEKHRLFTETATSSLFHFFSPPFSKEGSVGVSGGEVLVL